MPDFINLNNELQELLSLLEEDMSEKIMTKKQAKRRKALRAKKRAEKRAKEQAEQKKLLQQATQKEEPKEVELVDDGGDNNGDGKDKSGENDNQPTGTALVLYKGNSDGNSYESMSETFKTLMETIADIMKEFDAQKESAISAWKSKGDDSVCPIEEWEKLNTALTKMKTDIETLINNADTDSMEITELILLDRFTECFNGYLDKAQKQILSAKPNLDTQLLAGEVTDITTTDNDTTDDNSTDYHTKVTKNKKKLPKDRLKDNSRDKKDLVTYKTWYKGWKKTDDAWKALWESVKTLCKFIAEKALKPLYELSLDLTSWITDKLFAFLTSPVAKDFVKTLMYSNPITAMIYDGKFGSFGISGSMDKVKKSMQDKIQKAKGLTDPSKANPDNYDKNHFPKNTSKMTLREIKWNMEHNKELIYCINVSYNHKDVNVEEKGHLKTECANIFKAFEDKDITKARKSLTNIIEILRDICDYMNWTKPFDWMNIYSKWVKAQGNTKSEKEKIDKAAKEYKEKPKEKTNSDEIKLIGAIEYNINDGMSEKDIINKFTNGKYGKNSKDYIQTLIDKAKKPNESYIDITKNLQQLCENALA